MSVNHDQLTAFRHWCVLCDIYAFHRYTTYSMSLYQIQDLQYQRISGVKLRAFT